MRQAIATTHSRALKWVAVAAVLVGTVPLVAQQASNATPPPPSASQSSGNGPSRADMMAPRRPPMEHAFRMGPPGRWWDSPDMAQKLGLSTDQTRKMDDIFQQSRLKLIDQHASVEKEEAILEPLLAADQPDEGRILGQIDKVAQSRAELEKANARMLLGLRRVLTTAQWQTLQTLDPGPRGHRGPDRRDGARGRRGPDGPPPPPDAAGPAGEGDL